MKKEYLLCDNIHRYNANGESQMKKLLITLMVVVLGTGCAAMNEAQQKWNEDNEKYGYGRNAWMFAPSMYTWGASQNRTMPIVQPMQPMLQKPVTCTTTGNSVVCQ